MLDMLMGAPPRTDPFAAGTSAVEQQFKSFIGAKGLDGDPGVPTLASLRGVSHRFKNRRGAPGRPSFVDTGLYLNSFKAWVD